NGRSQTECRPHATRRLSPVFQSALKAQPLLRRNPEMISVQSRLQAVSHLLSHLPFSGPSRPSLSLVRLVGFASPPTTPLFHRCSAPAQPEVPWMHVPGAVRNIPPL